MYLLCSVFKRKFINEINLNWIIFQSVEDIFIKIILAIYTFYKSWVIILNKSWKKRLSSLISKCRRKIVIIKERKMISPNCYVWIRKQSRKWRRKMNWRLTGWMMRRTTTQSFRPGRIGHKRRITLTQSGSNWVTDTYSDTQIRGTIDEEGVVNIRDSTTLPYLGISSEADEESPQIDSVHRTKLEQKRMWWDITISCINMEQKSSQQILKLKRIQNLYCHFHHLSTRDYMSQRIMNL